jgi:uncharacterized protein YllA (UPF0747 family)
MKTERSNTSQKIEQMRNQLEKLFQGEKCHRQGSQKSQELVRKNIQIGIDQLRKREHIIPSKSALTNLEKESILYLNLSSRPTSFKVK